MSWRPSGVASQRRAHGARLLRDRAQSVARLHRYTRRPFPPYRHHPGRTPHPERDPRGHLFGADDAPQDDDFAFGVDLFNAGYWWEAHVYFEREWAEARAASDADAVLLFQGLVQIAAALLKKRQGVPAGEAKLRTKSAAHLRALRGRVGPVFRDIDLDPLIEAIDDGLEPRLRLSG